MVVLGYAVLSCAELLCLLLRLQMLHLQQMVAAAGHACGIGSSSGSSGSAGSLYCMVAAAGCLAECCACRQRLPRHRCCML
jgi:hypothetical protein